MVNIKNIKLKKIIYPALFVVFIIIVAVIFIQTIGFLADSIDKAFTLDPQIAESHLVKLDLGNFNAVTKKLSINVGSQSPVSSSQPIEVATPVATTTPNEAKEANKLDKTSVKIEVLNSTKTSGLAGELKAVLEADGFKVEKTGNFSPVQETTFIKIKDSKKDYASIVKESVSKKYQPGEDKLLEENDAYDIIIIIGNK
jgi:hypothetical protein